MLLRKENIVNQAIPENADGLVDIMKVNHVGAIESAAVRVDITHPFVGDLEVTVVAPSGKSVVLHNRQGGSSDNLVATFEGEVVESLIGESTAGEWKLIVKDFAPRDQGTLNSWQMDFQCAKMERPSEIFIPEKDDNGLNSVQECILTGKVTDLKVHVEIMHPFVGDLQVSLISPSGKSIVLHNREGGSSDNLVKTYEGEAVQAMIGENTYGQWTLQVKDFAPRDQGTLKYWKLEFSYQEADDLKVVEGIGPKIEELLHNSGIYTFVQLSTTETDQIRAVLNAGGDRFAIADPTTWPAQARMAAFGQWDELKQWQDELDGGRLPG